LSEEFTDGKRIEIEKKYERFCELFPCNNLALSATRFDMEKKEASVPMDELSLEKKMERMEASYLGYIAKYPLDYAIISFQLTIDGKRLVDIPNEKETEYLSALISAIADLYEYIGDDRWLISDFLHHERRSRLIEYLTYSTADKALIVAAIIVIEMKAGLGKMIGGETIEGIEDWGHLEIRIVT